MTQYSKLNIDSWSRKEHYNFFKNYANPLYNICTDVEITNLLKYTKENKISFFLAGLFLSTKAINNINEFKYRILEDEVVEFNVVHPFSTVLNNDETFSFCPFDFFDDFKDFYNTGLIALNNLSENQNKLGSKENRIDVIHYSTVPWFTITGMTNPVKSFNGNSIPKIIFSKYYTEGEIIKLPLCLEVNHALIDGLHIAKYLQLFNDYAKHAPELLRL